MSARETPAIADYALIGDCHSAALVSRAGSIDWCCLPRFDSGSCFGRLLDRDRGGFCDVSLRDCAEPEGSGAGDGRSREAHEGRRQRRGHEQEALSCSYLPDTLVLQTELRSAQATVRVYDFFAVHTGGALRPRGELIRVVECERGGTEVAIEVAPRFDYGAVRPWLRRAASDAFTAIGGDDGLLVWSDGELSREHGALVARRRIHAGERLRLLIRFVRPHLLATEQGAAPSAAEVDARLNETALWWRRWRERLRRDGPDHEALVRSALTLKALTYAPSGAIVAAATASLPETLGGERNWDYRYSWIRDSTLAAHSLAELGGEREARRFRHFIVRSSAGHAEDLQILFGVGGERRMPEQELELDGYRGSRPVRIGNEAAHQLQLDALGEILNLGWRWHTRGDSPDDDEWRFFAELVEVAVERWAEPDCGIWEWRGEPRHFVHSKACCWAAIDRGLRLAEECARRAPVRRWERAREEIRAAIEKRGYDAARGVFVQCFDEPQLDGALLLLPVVGFVDFADERMVRTTDAVREELDANGFLYRYRGEDELPGQEGAFLPCSFWLAECYARQGRLAQAREVFDRAVGAASPLGLFSEEIDPDSGELLGNYPQTLTHLSHVAAAIALADAAREQIPGADELAGSARS
ncbi:MAG TPA: glycoside hydrolase family 15 protein [Solirubrobacteraceae bacterium]|nr:glycoside hydrolase family 15 protein [Solirubrobacteraceae bacterium]